MNGQSFPAADESLRAQLALAVRMDDILAVGHAVTGLDSKGQNRERVFRLAIILSKGA